MPELTSPQVLLGVGDDGVLPRPSGRGSQWYKKIRLMRKDPTISLARQLSIAPVLASEWSVEAEAGAPPGAKEFITKEMMPLRTHILHTGFLGCIDFGWQPFEKVILVDDFAQMRVKKLKPLLQDITEILVDPATGAFVGLAQDELELTTDDCLLLNIDVEGTDWYGQSIMDIVEPTYDKWVTVDAAADRYDRKIAGAHWVVHYPQGTSTVDGVKVDNAVVADRILKKLEASGGIAVPTTVSKEVDDLNKDSKPAWIIDILDAKGGQTGFIDREKYLDALKVRAFGMPERAVLEGQFGTKAEAEAHGNIALLLQDFRHRRIVQQVNWHFVNHLLRLNFGPAAENLVYIRPAPLTDTSLMYLRDIYKEVLKDPNMMATETARMDMEALYDRLGIPIKELGTFDEPGVYEGVTGYVDDAPSIDPLSGVPLDDPMLVV